VKTRFVNLIPKQQLRKANQTSWLYATGNPINEQNEKA